MTKDPQEIDQALGQVQKFVYEGHYQRGLESALAILETSPKHTEALYMAAVCQRYLGKTDEAFATLGDLKSIAPDFGRAHQEEGHLYRNLGKPDKALVAFQRATQANPALEASWRAQANILIAYGRQVEAAQLQAQADRLVAMPRELVAVTNYIHEGKLLQAEGLCRHYLQSHKQDIEGMRLLADIGSRFGVLEDAEFLLESAVEFAPQNIQVRLDYIQILRKRQKFEAALNQAKYLYDQEPDSPIFQSHYAVENMQAGNYEMAFDLFERVLEKLPEDSATLTSRAHALKTWGKHEEAVSSYRSAYTAKPDHGDAYFGLANLKTYKFEDYELEAMLQQEQSSDLSYQARIYFCFALGKAYEDRAAYEESFKYYERGNDLKRVQSRYDADQMTEELQAQSTICTTELFEKQAKKGCAVADPIFVLGLPRAGSTLLEQILASHSQIDGTQELPNILALSQRLRRRKRVSTETHYPKVLHDLTAGQLAEFGNAFIEDTKIHRQGAPFFIDKMPNNFRHIGLIQLILPNAKIIDARRHPMDCCFSGFKQLFAEGQEFTYGLEVVGQYYRDYVDLMDHWDKVLPGKILRVQYEDVVADTEGQVKRMLDYLDLPFENACVEFHKTKRSVRTASSEQVRQPINTKGIEQWRHYEKWLNPLKQALGPVLDSHTIPS